MNAIVLILLNKCYSCSSNVPRTTALQIVRQTGKTTVNGLDRVVRWLTDFKITRTGELAIVTVSNTVSLICVYIFYGRDA